MGEEIKTPVNAVAELQVSASRMEASFIIKPPQNGGEDLTKKAFEFILKDKGITTGILWDRIEKLVQKPIYDEPIVIARGIESVNGKDAEIIFHFRTERNLKPKENENGSVDFKDLGLIEAVEKGALLCEKQIATTGKPGTDIFGKWLEVKHGKDRQLPTGKNTRASDDKFKLFAEIDGQVELLGGRVHVFDTYTVQGDVSPATGNIQFPGNIVITGGVLAGFSVQAAGNIDVGGIVEGADVMAGGSLIIRGGFNGGNTGSIDVGESLACRFIQNGSVTVLGDIETTYILNSTIICGGSVNLTGKGLIMGGSITARGSVSAVFLGSASSASDTLIEVGSSPRLVKRSRELPNELASCEKNLRDVETMVKSLLRLKNAGALTPDKMESLAKALKYLSRLQTLREDLEAENELIQKQLSDVGNSMVKVSRTAYPGVKITIGNEQFPLKSEFNFTSFRRTRDGIACSPLR